MAKRFKTNLLYYSIHKKSEQKKGSCNTKPLFGYNTLRYQVIKGHKMS